MNNSNVGQNDLSHDNKVENNIVGRAESENVWQASIKYNNHDDLTAGSYEKDKSSKGEPEITFDESNDSKTT